MFSNSENSRSSNTLRNKSNRKGGTGNYVFYRCTLPYSMISCSDSGPQREVRILKKVSPWCGSVAVFLVQSDSGHAGYNSTAQSRNTRDRATREQTRVPLAEQPARRWRRGRGLAEEDARGGGPVFGRRTPLCAVEGLSGRSLKEDANPSVDYVWFCLLRVVAVCCCCRVCAGMCSSEPRRQAQEGGHRGRCGRYSFDEDVSCVSAQLEGDKNYLL